MNANFNGWLDRASIALRITSVLILLPYAFWLLIADKWRVSEHLLLFGVGLIGSMLLYHLLTSVRRCEHCGNLVVNLGIGPADTRGKRFKCLHCGGETASNEGFVWQRQVSG